MASKGIRPLSEFNPTDPNTGAPEWELYKRDFLIHLDALGLDDKPGRRKVGVLLSNMGREAVKIYDSFEWAIAVEADEGAGILAQPAEDRYDLETVFAKFDRHFGVHNYRNIKRQEFLNTKRANMSIMDYISELKRKAEHCQYGDHKEGFICDMIINGVNDKRCSEKLMEITPNELTLERVISTCRQVELTSAHLKSLGAENPHVNIVKRGRWRGSGSRGQSHTYVGNEMYYCNRCCNRHLQRRCPAYNKHCDRCGQRGHFKVSKLCQANSDRNRSTFRNSNRGRARGQGIRRRGNMNRVHYVNENELCEMFDDCATVQDVFSARTGSRDDAEWKVKLKVGQFDLLLEIDSGAMCNVLSKEMAQMFSELGPLKQSDTIIKGVSGVQTKALGMITLPCEYKGLRRNINFQVVDTPGNVNLLGRDDSVSLGLIARVNKVEISTDRILKEYRDVLGDEIGCLPGEYEIKIDESITPVIHAPRPVPVAIRDQLKMELDHLEKCGIIVPVKEPTKWVNSMVCVRKKNGRVRICIDPTDLNKAIKREHYPMNTIDEVATRLHGSKYFTKLDANMGYYQVKLTESSSQLTTFNSPYGRYRYLRMPMGLKCAGEVFQREMETHIGSIEGAEIVVDDILVHGKDIDEHNIRLRNVLEKSRSINLKLNKDKCKFAQSEVNYVGHKLTGEGIMPTDERISAIVNMKEPENHNELETVLGMLSYVSKFIPCLSELNAPLRDIKMKQEWSWGDKEKSAFDNIKSVLTSTKVLRYFDVKKPVTLTVDASMRGLGAAIIQKNGVVAYASRSLSPAEQRYAQIEKEMLAVVFGCERFHKLLYGKHDITIESDHKPLESLMKKPIHAAPMRIQRMMLKLQPYEFTLVHRSGKDMGLADCLSRLPLAEIGDSSIDDELMVLTIDTLSSSNHEKIREATKTDEQLQILKQVISSGWPAAKSLLPLEAMPFWDHRDQMATYNGVIYRGERVCIPAPLRGETLKVIHKSHLGSVNCKKRARELVFWPGMNQQIEEMVSKCSACLRYRMKAAKEPMVIQPIPSLPWSKVGTDLCEINGNHYLIMVDYYSNFIEVAPLQRDTKSSTIIRHMKQNIARYGIMDTLISDNGPQYTSAEFKEFTQSYDIKHMTSSPLHQQTNGLAEKAVQTVKNMIKKCVEAGDDIYLSLLELRNTPRDSEIGSPMQRLMGRRAKTLIPITPNLRKPKSDKADSVTSKLVEYREKQKWYYDQKTRPKSDLKPSDAVRIHTPTGWQPAEYVRKSVYPRSHIVKAGSSGREYRRNSEMLMKTREEPHTIIAKDNDGPPSYVIPKRAPNSTTKRASNDSTKRVSDNQKQKVSETSSTNNIAPNIQSDVGRDRMDVAPTQPSVKLKSRYGREIRKPRRFDDFS